MENLPLIGVLDLQRSCVHFNNNHVIKRHLKALANEEGQVELNVDKITYKRTTQQNRYYWGVCVATILAFIKDTQGEKYSRDEVHQLNLNTVFGDTMERREIIDPLTGNTIQGYFSKVKSTSKMNTKEFTDFIEELRAIWSGYGCVIPDPTTDKNPLFLDDIVIDLSDK